MVAWQREADHRKGAVRGGLIAGLIGGAVLGLFLVVVSLASGRDVWVDLKGAAYPFLRDRALQPGFDGGAVLLGLLCHFIVSAVWGAVFGVLSYGLGAGATGGAGLIFGLVVWIVMYYVALPLVGAAEIAHLTPLRQAIFQHLLFGISTAIAFLPFQAKAPHVTVHVPGSVAPR